MPSVLSLHLALTSADCLLTDRCPRALLVTFNHKHLACNSWKRDKTNTVQGVCTVIGQARVHFPAPWKGAPGKQSELSSLGVRQCVPECQFSTLLAISSPPPHFFENVFFFLTWYILIMVSPPSAPPSSLSPPPHPSRPPPFLSLRRKQTGF